MNEHNLKGQLIQPGKEIMVRHFDKAQCRQAHHPVRLRLGTSPRRERSRGTGFLVDLQAVA
jgi:hypothetical protein